MYLYSHEFLKCLGYSQASQNTRILFSVIFAFLKYIRKCWDAECEVNEWCRLSAAAAEWNLKKSVIESARLVWNTRKLKGCIFTPTHDNIMQNASKHTSKYIRFVCLQNRFGMYFLSPVLTDNIFEVKNIKCQNFEVIYFKLFIFYYLK